MPNIFNAADRINFVVPRSEATRPTISRRWFPLMQSTRVGLLLTSTSYSGPNETTLANWSSPLNGDYRMQILDDDKIIDAVQQTNSLLASNPEQTVMIFDEPQRVLAFLMARQIVSDRTQYGSMTRSAFGDECARENITEPELIEMLFWQSQQPAGLTQFRPVPESATENRYRVFRSSQPGYQGEDEPHTWLPDQVQFLNDQGVGLIISLNTCRPTEPPTLPEANLRIEHLPVPVRDHTEPNRSDVEKVVRAIRKVNQLGRAALIHCGYGHGRTGTMVMAWQIVEARNTFEGLDESAFTARCSRAHVEELRQIRFLYDLWQNPLVVDPPVVAAPTPIDHQSDAPTLAPAAAVRSGRDPAQVLVETPVTEPLWFMDFQGTVANEPDVEKNAYLESLFAVATSQAAAAVATNDEV